MEIRALKAGSGWVQRLVGQVIFLSQLILECKA